MPKHDVYETPLVTRYASREMCELFGARRRILTWRRLWLALAKAEHDSDTRIIIVDIGEIVGMVVDGVRDVIRLPDSAISPPPPMIQGISADYLKGIGQFDERLLIMLDLEKVLTAEEQEILRELGPDGIPLGSTADQVRGLGVNVRF